MQRIAILKADDLGLGGIDKFRQLINICGDWQVPISIGIVANRIQNMSNVDKKYFRACFEDPMIEAWNHSYSHRDLTTLSYDQQLQDLEQSQFIIETEFGVKCDVFGAPYNRYNLDTVNALNACDSFDSVYLLEPDLAKLSKLFNIPRNTLVSPEFVRDWSRQNHFEEFVRRCKLKNSMDAITVQFHPPAWNSLGFSEFERCLEFLLMEGYRFLTMSEYSSYIENIDLELKAEVPSKFVNAIYIDSSLESSNLNNSKLDLGEKLGPYYFNRHVVGTQHVLRSFKRIRFDESPESLVNGEHSVLDIGCGSGNWLVGYGLMHPEAHLFGMDKSEACLKISKSTFAAAGMESRSSLLLANLNDQVILDSKRFNRIFCINSAQYMNKENLFNFAHKNLLHLGDFLLQLQTYEYFVASAYNELIVDHVNYESAFNRLDSIILSFAKKHGVVGLRSAVNVYDERELVFAAKHSGFDVIVEGASFEKPTPQFNGSPFLRTYHFANRVRAFDKDNGYSNFAALNDADRIKYLDGLRANGLWYRVKELVANCQESIPNSYRDDYQILFELISNGISKEKFRSLGLGVSTPVRCLWSLSFGDYENELLKLDNNFNDECWVYRLMASYFSGAFNNVVSITNDISEGNLEPIIYIFRAAAAIKLALVDEAMVAIENFINYRKKYLQ